MTHQILRPPFQELWAGGLVTRQGHGSRHIGAAVGVDEDHRTKKMCGGECTRLPYGRVR